MSIPSVSFKWISVYKAIAKQIRLRDNKQGKQELLQIAHRDLGIEKDYVDPFAMFLSFNRSNGGRRRIQKIKKLMESLGVNEPFDDDLGGIPTAYYAFGIVAHNKEQAKISWEFFNLIVDKGNDSLSDPQFVPLMNEVASFNEAGDFNDLTKVMYTINPYTFFPLQRHNNDLVKEKFGIDPAKIVSHSAKGYVDFIKQLKHATATPFWELAHEADPHYRNADSGNEFLNTISPISLNTILYGPPGTGKTYKVADIAWRIAHKGENLLSHDEAQEWYDTQLNNPDGQVAFTTFHQSYSYEDFIEGIRPVLADGESDTGSGLNYCISDGVFKAFCERASAPASAEDLGLNDNPAVWKVSLKGTGDNEVRDDCLKNSHIRIGWDSYGPQVDDQTNFEHGGERVLDAFLNKMSIGDIVVSCYSATTTDAIGVITGEAEWHDEYQNYKRQRKVKWLVKDIRCNIVKRFGIPNMTLATIYRLSRLNEGDILTLVSELKNEPSLAEANTKPYIFIIDEINRGNVSSIFGELITLLEPSKREGASDQQTAILPYSKEKFAVPSNVYVVATMNTADKSLTQLDTALRRRFDFIEMMPKSKLLENDEVEGVELEKLLEAMNARIAALYDREHEIGHSYLMHLDGDLNKLKKAFEKKIVPLLQEYFYDDYSKIRQVLNEADETADSFIVKDDVFERYARDVGDDDTCWKLGDPKDWDAENFKKIYEVPKNSEVDDED